MKNNISKIKKLSIYDIYEKLFDIKFNHNNISNKNNIIYKNNLYSIKNINRENSINIETDLIKERMKTDNLEKFNLINFKLNMIKEIEKYQERLKYLKEYYKNGKPPLKYQDEDIEKNSFKNPYIQ